MAAVRILIAWQEERASAEQLVHSFEATSPPDAREFAVAGRRRLRELVFGCVRLRGRYDHLIAQLTRKPPEPALRAILWIGLHEICELSTPEHAAVSSSVELTRALELGHASGFVNGILRRVLREGVESFFPKAQDDAIAHAVSWLSHPEWLVRRWSAMLDESDFLELCRANNRRPSLVLRSGKGGRKQLLRAIADLEWEAEAGRWSADAVVMRTRVPVSLVLDQLPPPVTVQDEAAQVVPELLLPERPTRVLDICAAPGGKALQLAELLGEQSLVVAADLHAGRLKRLAQSKQRLGMVELHALVADAGHAPFAPGSFDAVLLDAPCTGTGVLARRHEARWRRKPADLEELPVLQRKLLHSAVDLCEPGGIIVYATCSLEPEENDGVVDRVLAERDDLRELGAQARVDSELLNGRRLQVWPQRHGCDGAFAAVLQRTESAA